MISTRFAQHGDLSTIFELVHLKAAFDGFPDSVTATSEALEKGLFSDSPEAEVLLAESDGEVIGMASFHSHCSTFIARPGLWLDDLFIREEHRSLGAGEAPMIRLSQVCRDRGGSRIEWSTAARNTLGINFYERIGSTVFEGSRLTRLEGAALEQLASLPSTERRANTGR